MIFHPKGDLFLIRLRQFCQSLNFTIDAFIKNHLEYLKILFGGLYN